MEYTAEDYIKLIEQRRFDKIGAWAMEIIAKKYRRLEQNQGQTLPIDIVRLSLFNEVYDKFVECEDDNEFTQYLNEKTNEV